jgi:acyl-[acyl-carrier-protein]-phospholipid O-acyltransferase/long-chain-fatty-acid--[acyl-carrier-protein] ligase
VINFLITRIAYRIQVHGLNNIPEKGGVILVPNHVSYIDGLLLWSACRKRNVSFMIYHKLYHLKIFNWLFKILKYIPVYEGKRVKESLDAAKQHLQKGGTICIFPEGELTRTGSMLPFRRGVEKLIEGVSSKNVPIIPVYIDQVWGSIFSYERNRFFFKIPHEFPSKVSITFGKPLPADSKSHTIRKAVTELGYQSTQQRKSNEDILPLGLLKIAKKRWFSPMLTMPQIKPISFGTLVIMALNLVKRLKHQLNPDSTIIGVVGNPSLFSTAINLALSFTNKTVVNLPSTLSTDEMLKRCEILNVQEVLTYDSSLRLNTIPIHLISNYDLYPSLIKSFIIGLRLFFTPSTLLVRKILKNTAKPDDTTAILWEAEKPIYITHYNILANAEAFSQLLFMRHNDWILSEASLQSTVGYIGQFWYPLLNAVGMACTNVDEKQLSISTINALMKQYQITLMISKTEFYRNILASGQSLTFPNIRFAVAVGMAEDLSIYEEFEEQIHVELFEGFGLPELPLVISLNHHSYISKDLKQLGSKKGSFGKPLPGILAEIVDPNTNTILLPGEEGVLVVKGANTPENVKPESGWVNTHRKAFIDSDGFIHFISDH